MGLVFGAVDATPKPDTSFPPARRRVLLHDHAGTGFPSWVPLHDGFTPRGLVHFDGNAMVLVTGHENFGGANSQFYSGMALSRLVRPSGWTKLYVEWEWAGRVHHAAGTVYNFCKGFNFGIDTADGGTAGAQPALGRRTLAMARCAIFDESAATYFGGKWQLTTGDATTPTNTDLTDASANKVSPTVAGYEALAVGQNYGKVLRQYTEQVFDLSGGGVVGATTAVLEGLRHNGVGFGSLATGTTGYDPSLTTNPRAGELKSTVPATTTDGGFQNGLNLCAQIENRSNQPYGSTLYVYRVRAVAF